MERKRASYGSIVNTDNLPTLPARHNTVLPNSEVRPSTTRFVECEVEISELKNDMPEVNGGYNDSNSDSDVVASHSSKRSNVSHSSKKGEYTETITHAIKII